MKLITIKRGSGKELRKVFRIMKLSLLMLILVTYCWATDKSYAQVAEISVSAGNKSLKELFSEIERKSEFIFFYNDEAIDLSRVVHVSHNTGTIEEILDQVLKNTQTEYKIVDRQVIFYKKEAKRQASEAIPQQSNKELISGKVSDAQGVPVIGANIIEKGTTNGIVTDLDGNFTLNVEKGAILVVSYIGYLTQEIPVRNNKQFNILLKEDSQALDEVVVVGYGTQKKVNLTGSVDVISEKLLANRSAPTVSQLMQGASPNLMIGMTNLGGEPGAKRTWNIRGMGSIQGDGTPLILIDGVESNIDNIDPESIESISVLKDASASAIYGSRAPFGVILVTTKKGGKNDVRIEYNNNLSFAMPLDVPHFVDALTWVTAYNQIQTNSGLAPIYPDEQVERIKGYMAGTYKTEYNPEKPPASMWRGRWDGNANYDWPALYFKKAAFSQKHNINIGGGGEKVQYFASAGFLDQGGLYNWGDDLYKRYNVMANITSQVNSWLRFDLNTKYSRTEIDRPLGIVGQPQSYIHRQFLSFGPLMPKYNEDGSISNPLIRALQDGGREHMQNNDLALTLKGEIEPIKGWVTNVSYNYHYGGSSNIQNPKPVEVQAPSGSIGNIGAPQSGSVEQLAYSYYNLFNVVTSYEKLLGDHYFKVLAGYEQETDYFRGLYGSKMDLITPEVPSINTALGTVTLSDAINHWSTQGVFGRLNYNYKEKYLAEFSARYNGSSKFAKNSRWGFFPSVSVGYNIAREDFWKPIELYVNSLKFRGSYGSLGNQNVSNYMYLSTVPVHRDMPYIIGNSLPIFATVPGLVPSDLTWETVTTLNIGLDAGFLSNRLGVTFDWYNRVTSDMFGPAVSLPAILGTSAPFSNNAEMSTKGFELTVSWRDQLSSGLAYNVAFSLGDNRSEILKYNNESKIISQWYEGKNVGEIWGYVSDGLIQTEGESMPDQSKIYGTWGPGDMKYKDLNGDNIIDDGSRTVDDHGDLKVIGNNTPRYNMGITAGFNWKGIDFNMFWQGVGKRDYWANATLNKFYGIVPGGSPGSESALYKDSKNLDYWRPADEQSSLGPNTDAYFPKPYFTTELDKNRQVQSKYILNAAYLRLKSMQIGYTLPEELVRKFFLHRVRFYVSGENLLTITKFPRTLDPETTIASDPDIGGRAGKENAGSIYPISRNFSFGVNLTF